MAHVENWTLLWLYLFAIKLVSWTFELTLVQLADPNARMSLTTKPAECPAIWPAPLFSMEVQR